jgi:hypothetical protein
VQHRQLHDEDAAAPLKTMVAAMTLLPPVAPWPRVGLCLCLTRGVEGWEARAEVRRDALSRGGISRGGACAPTLVPVQPLERLEHAVDGGQVADDPCAAFQLHAAAGSTEQAVALVVRPRKETF